MIQHPLEQPITSAMPIQNRYGASVYIYRFQNGWDFKGIFAFAYGLDKGAYIGLNVGQHFTGFKVVEYIPTQILVFRFYPGVLADHTHAVMKHFVFQGYTQQIGIGFCLQLIVIQ